MYHIIKKSGVFFFARLCEYIYFKQIADFALSIEQEFPLDRLPVNFDRKILSAFENYLKMVSYVKEIKLMVDVL